VEKCCLAPWSKNGTRHAVITGVQCHLDAAPCLAMRKKVALSGGECFLALY